MIATAPDTRRKPSAAAPDADVRVDEGFAALIPPLTPGERAELERRLLAEGCREPLLAWDGVLIDGHNRLAICRAHGLPFRVRAEHFPDRAAAEAFIIAIHMGRRSLSAEATAYFRGRRYLAEKRGHGGARPRASANAQDAPLKTAERLAAEYRVNQATVRRDAHFARAVDAVVTNSGRGAAARNAILARDGGLRRDAVLRLARRPAEEQRAAIAALLATGKLPRGEAEPKARISLPTEPKALAAKLLGRLGRNAARAVVRALSRLLKGKTPAAEDAP
jgi:hypothetical protein